MLFSHCESREVLLMALPSDWRGAVGCRGFRMDERAQAWLLLRWSRRQKNGESGYLQIAKALFVTGEGGGGGGRVNRRPGLRGNDAPFTYDL